uniref:Uncharacterized protein n=1 Tax=Romanomermis culicivorax TaxID=13658 RepID=A0A915IGG0_ROMCU
MFYLCKDADYHDQLNWEDIEAVVVYIVTKGNDDDHQAMTETYNDLKWPRFCVYLRQKLEKLIRMEIRNEQPQTNE